MPAQPAARLRWFLPGNGVIAPGMAVALWSVRYPLTNIRNGGKFSGTTLEGGVAF